MRPAHEDPDLHVFLAAAPAEQAAWLRARGLPPAVLLPLVNACAQRCFFCAGPGTSDLPDAARTPSDAVRAHLAARPEGVTTLLVGGNEPTLHPDLAWVYAHARGLGYRRIELMTSGATLAANVPAWAAAGLAEVVVPLYSVDAAAHDAVTGAPAHTQVLAGLDAAHAAGVAVRVHTLLLRRTLPGLPALARFVRRRYGYPLAFGLLREKPGLAWNDEAPTLAAIRAALAAVAAEDRPAPLVAPLCLGWGTGNGVLPAATAAPAEAAPEAALLARLYFSSQARLYPAGCDGCAVRTRCPGVVAAYA